MQLTARRAVARQIGRSASQPAFAKVTAVRQSFNDGGTPAGQHQRLGELAMG
jgi:hypothetical protein